MSQIHDASDAFVTDFDHRLSRSQFEARARQGASALRAMGAGEDVPVALIMRNDLAHLEIMHAAALAGTVIVALNWHAAADEVADICTDSGAQFVIVHRDLIKDLRPALEGRHIVGVCPGAPLRDAYEIDAEQAHFAPEYPESEDLLKASPPLADRAQMRSYLRYTSGSTGKPKGVRRLQTGIRKDFEDVLHTVASDMLQLAPGARFFTAAPIFHSAPSTLISAALVAPGVATLLAPRFDPEGFLATIQAERITHIYLVPTMMSRMLKLPANVRARYDLSSVTFAV